MDKLFLLDAYALIYRSYYALIRNPRINSKGFNTSAIVGFCNTLNEILTKEKPNYIGVAFDHGKTFRHKVFPEYKAQREETPEDIKAAIPIIKDILKAYKIPILQVDGYEADDIIGTVATITGKLGIETYMLTPDKDYGQLVKPNVYMYRPQHGGGYEILGEKEIIEKYGIGSSKQVIDLLALMGDSADNYPGCPGVGEKTATKLINQFGSVEGLLANTDKLKGKMKEKVEKATEDIKMSYFLATIKTDIPLEQFKIDDLKVEEPDEEKLDKIFTELEFKSFKSKILKKSKNKQKDNNQQLDLFSEFTDDRQGDIENSSYESLKTTPHEYKLVDNQEDINKLYDFLLTKEILSLDTETTSTHPVDAELVGLSFSVEENKAFYIPIPSKYKDAIEIINKFKPIYENEKILKIGQNIKYDYEVLKKYGVEIKGKMFDTMIAHYLIQPELHHNMDYMAEVYLKYQTIHIEELIGPKGKNQKNMRDLDPKEIYEYASEDADVTLKLYHVLEPKLKEVNAEHLFWNIEMPLVPVLADMELNGVCLDTDALKETSKIFNKRMAKYEQEIYEEAGETFNISSPKQVGEILFGKMKIIEKPKKTKTGQYVTSEEVLQTLRSKNKIVDNILNYRGLKKLLNTYIDNLPTLINPQTGHIHTSFNQALTATGRLSSSDPNLQNIPIRSEDGKEIRKCFIPEYGCLFFSADYSQIELRIMAHLSGDENMIEAFKEGFDIHKTTAARIWKKPIEEVSDSERKKAKQANFGIIYGITTYGLAQRMEIPNGEARDLIHDYFETFPKVHEYMEKAKEIARQKGYAETIFGRRRYLADINSHNGTVRGYAERNAINAPIQGSEADIIKVAMIRIWQRFRKEGIQSKMILQVHDELNFSVYPEEKEKVEKIVLEEMQNAYHLNVPLIADAGWGKNWLEAH
ncbi:DNA polymerase I [Segatella albensis]|jgi:DNA polymerase-1|uniref:DNA polymerase I n=1 Tax=Segatella albensis TaxID=77768 RepID=UPI000414A7F4|nr:DNA polymerase I [Segatella albensis]